MRQPLPHFPRSVGVGVLCLIGSVTACGEATETASFDDYLADLQEICTATTEQLTALPSAPDQIAVTDLATSAAGVLDDEANRVSRLDVPTGDDVTLDDLAGDHRAFVRNTREQATAWRDVAVAEDLAEPTQLIAQLVGGRNELAESMGALGCVRGDL